MATRTRAAIIEYPAEAQCRRPRFAADVPVKLANGETWHLPYAVPGPLEWGGRGGVPECRLRVAGEFSDEATDAAALLAMVAEARGHRVPGPAVVGMLAVVAASLLRVNYDLSFPMAMVLVRHGFEVKGEGLNFDLLLGAVAEAVDHAAIGKRRASVPRNPRDQ